MRSRPRGSLVASFFVSRWDAAVTHDLASPFHNSLGITIIMRSCKTHCKLLALDRWKQLANAGARPKRVLFAGTGTKNASAPDALYVQALAATGTIHTLLEKTLLALADHCNSERALPIDGGNAETVRIEFRCAADDGEALAARLQREGVDAFANSCMLC